MAVLRRAKLPAGSASLRYKRLPSGNKQTVSWRIRESFQGASNAMGHNRSYHSRTVSNYNCLGRNGDHYRQNTMLPWLHLGRLLSQPQLPNSSSTLLTHSIPINSNNHYNLDLWSHNHIPLSCIRDER